MHAHGTPLSTPSSTIQLTFQGRVRALQLPQTEDSEGEKRKAWCPIGEIRQKGTEMAEQEKAQGDLGAEIHAPKWGCPAPSPLSCDPPNS